VETGAVRPAPTVRLHARPADREAVRVDTEARDQLEVLLPAMKVVGGDARVAAVGDAPRRACEAVPDALAPARLRDGALDLEGRARDAPHEVVPQRAHL